jgi:hypothetical protein
MMENRLLWCVFTKGQITPSCWCHSLALAHQAVQFPNCLLWEIQSKEATVCCVASMSSKNSKLNPCSCLFSESHNKAWIALNYLLSFLSWILGSLTLTNKPDSFFQRTGCVLLCMPSWLGDQRSLTLGIFPRGNHGKESWTVVRLGSSESCVRHSPQPPYPPFFSPAAPPGKDLVGPDTNDLERSHQGSITRRLGRDVRAVDIFILLLSYSFCF